VEVEEDSSDLINQMTGHESVDGKMKAEHLDVEAEA